MATAVTVAMAAATRPIALTSAHRARRAKGGTDRLSVVLFSTAAFLVVLALLAWQLKAPPARAARPVVLMKRIYTTTVIETVPGSGRPSMSQSVSSSGSTYAASTSPTTRTS
jgi:hypothetical protein